MGLRQDVAGVPVVTITVAEYADLLNCRRQLAELGMRERTFNAVSRSPIERDPEVAVFIAERLGSKYLREIREECAKQFGRRRTPSMSAIHRFWLRLRPHKASSSQEIPRHPG
jgi:hypothetical protein